ncbi:50S ribosomal protein L4 [Ignicoccus hospitalis]|uniref:Large ribosomal subunit protein uL4 n=1 Tax=Ignicoccus hospitalis (strain KIN4/I / DSM 18386 / JCM 14125) TaxID=453591 RepID=A8AB43_IGNH4|nr:50S ribosomal protein L4 [Ignicoccus hospitalis]ABU82145.1 LSU ribosomal protein L4P [Ignicoccus hospitalis KIN4/I]
MYSSLWLHARVFGYNDLKRHVWDLNGNPVEEIELPPVFSLPVRKDLIRRAFLSAFTARLQPKGRDPMAGKRTTAESLGPGHGLARVPRIKGTSRAAFVNSARGGHLAFPPRPDKKLHEEINKKERLIAIASALAATSRRELVEARGHAISSVKEVPLIVVDDIENIEKAKDLREAFVKLGVIDDVERASEWRQRSTKGKMRGRRYKKRVGPLIIVSTEEAPVRRAASAFPGTDVVAVNLLSVKHLAPGGVPGRLTIISKKALEEIGKRLTL